MSTITEQRIRALTQAQRLQLIRDHDEFERPGMIGDCELRRQAEELMSEFGDAGHVVLWMERLAFEAYRYYARLWIEKETRRNEGPAPCSEIPLGDATVCTLTVDEENKS
jgi:hypothetical protein